MKNKFEPWLDVLGNTLDKNDFMLNYDEYCKYLYVYMDFTNFINNVQKEFFLYTYDLKVDDECLELIWDEYPEDYIGFIKFIKENKGGGVNDYLIDSIDFFYDDDRDFIFMEKKISSLSHNNYMYAFPGSYKKQDVIEFVNGYEPPLISKTRTLYSNYLRVFNSMICLFNNSFVIISEDLKFIAFVKKNHFIISFTKYN
ncbi:hypothetical protein A1D29_00895 [Pasteurellaceae bacterium Orientalotternb1]|nr:hypothetical protein A1D29_00895 [Pasteurellaceae bacterium Orientalotternb1]